MKHAFRFIAGGWTFFWRQPALQRSTILLVFVPLLAMEFLDRPFDVAHPQQLAVLVVLHIAMIILLTWGIACTLTVGRRMLQAKSGRLRTSFNAVQGQARGLIIPLLLTDILRGCITLLWGVPLAALVIIAGMLADEQNVTFVAFVRMYPWLIVLAILGVLPPVLYAIQTILTPFVVAYEKVAFRLALARSRQLVRGRLPQTTVIIVLLGLLWIPGIVLKEAIVTFAEPLVAFFVGPVVSAFFGTFALVLWLLGVTQYYKALGGKAKAVEND